MELTILMPCLNEAATIRACVEQARDYIQSRQIVEGVERRRRLHRPLEGGRAIAPGVVGEYLGVMRQAGDGSVRPVGLRSDAGHPGIRVDLPGRARFQYLVVRL